MKRFLKLFIPPVFYKLKRMARSSVSKTVNSLPKMENISSKMLIIGNGPTLNQSIEKYFDVIINMDKLMVNHSAVTALYEKIQPNYYLLVDPAWINPENSTHRDAIYKTIEAIRTKTSWNMMLVMPQSAIGCYAVERFKGNPKIQLLFYEDGWTYHDRLSQLEAWDKNLIAPPTQTVLNSAVWLSIYWGYKETYLIGADTSFLADLKVDQQSNLLYTVDTHFYDNKEVYEKSYDSVHNRHFIGTTLHEELFSIGTALKGYWDMREYADWKGVKVYNASEYSWIDAFERKKLE